MASTTSSRVDWVGHDLADMHGRPIGRICELFTDRATGQREWIAVSLSTGSGERAVPIIEAVERAGTITVPHAAGTVATSPAVDASRPLTQDQADRLAAHYGLDYSKRRSPSGMQDATQAPTAAASRQTRGSAPRRQAGSSQSRNFVHGTPDGDAWAVILEQSSRARSKHRTQAQAVKAARDTARRRQTEVVIHGRDGKIRDRRNYGGDPPHSKG